LIVSALEQTNGFNEESRSDRSEINEKVYATLIDKPGKRIV
jgi:hypothetical protein